MVKEKNKMTTKPTIIDLRKRDLDYQRIMLELATLGDLSPQWSFVTNNGIAAVTQLLAEIKELKEQVAEHIKERDEARAKVVRCIYEDWLFEGEEYRKAVYGNETVTENSIAKNLYGQPVADKLFPLAQPVDLGVATLSLYTVLPGQPVNQVGGITTGQFFPEEKK